MLNYSFLWEKKPHRICVFFPLTNKIPVVSSAFILDLYTCYKTTEYNICNPQNQVQSSQIFLSQKEKNNQFSVYYRDLV